MAAVASAKLARRAAIYARISLDRTGAGLGIERQVDDCMALASGRGYVVEGIYKDNDISAYSGRVRPDYRKLLAVMEAGAVDVVVAWHTTVCTAHPVSSRNT
jgi:site-specific DNA recombinase